MTTSEGHAMAKTETSAWDMADHIKSAEDIETYLDAAFANQAKQLICLVGPAGLEPTTTPL